MFLRNKHMITSSNGTFSALQAICVGGLQVTGEFTAQGTVKRSFDIFFDLSPNKWFRKQSWRWWFETSSRSLWRHCNDLWHFTRILSQFSFKMKWKYRLQNGDQFVPASRCKTDSFDIACVNTLRPRQNGRHCADDIFKRIFFNENVWISIKISLKFVPKGPINNIPALVQIMAWRRPGDKPLSEPMMVS